MGLTIFEYEFHIYNRVPSQWPFKDNFVESFLNSCNKLVRDIRSNDFIFELTAKDTVRLKINLLMKDIYIFEGFSITYNPSKLTCSTRLFLMQIIIRCLARDGLSIVDCWLTQFYINLVLSPHSFSVDLQMQFSHSRNNHFFRFDIHIYIKSWVLPFETIQSLLEFATVFFLSWPNR